MTRALASIHLAVALAACGASHSGDDSSPAAASAAPRVHPIAELPVTRWTGGLPVSGGTLTVDLSPDVARGVADWSQVTGTVAFECHDCTLGDDRTPYTWMMAQLVGHLSFDQVRARADFAGGVVRVSASGRGDLDFDASLVGTLGRAADDTRLDGCVAYAPTERLHARDAKLHDALRLMYLPGDDGRRRVAISGTLGVPRIMGMACAVAPAHP